MNDNQELVDRLHKFEVVCKVAIQLRLAGSANTPLIERLKLNKIGAANPFLLERRDRVRCLARAKNFLDDVRRADLIRLKAA